jgi:hypothetical protein
MLTRRTRRGVIIFNVLRYGFAVAAGIEMCNQEWFGGVGAILGAVLFGLGYDHVKKRRDAALLLAQQPHLVYWAHPTRVTAAMARHPAGNIAPLTVHLRNGNQFEATLSPSEQRIFVEWLSQANPTIRWGPYDDVPVSA